MGRVINGRRVFWTLIDGMFVNRLASFVATFISLYLKSRGWAPDEAGRVVALFGVGVLVATRRPS